MGEGGLAGVGGGCILTCPTLMRELRQESRIGAHGGGVQGHLWESGFGSTVSVTVNREVTRTSLGCRKKKKATVCRTSQPEEQDEAEGHKRTL